MCWFTKWGWLGKVGCHLVTLNNSLSAYYVPAVIKKKGIKNMPLLSAFSVCVRLRLNLGLTKKICNLLTRRLQSYYYSHSTDKKTQTGVDSYFPQYLSINLAKSWGEPNGSGIKDPPLFSQRLLLAAGELPLMSQTPHLTICPWCPSKQGHAWDTVGAQEIFVIECRLSSAWSLLLCG